MTTESLTFWHRIKQWNAWFERVTHIESRGIARVLPSEQRSSSYLQIGLMWLSCDLTANCITLAMLGPLVFNLGFIDSAVCAVSGAAIGSLGPAYISTWGSRSGLRTMIIARWFMGYYPALLTAFLSLVNILGYATINCIITGQLLSAVAGGSLSLVPGIVIVSLITLPISVFGMNAFARYQRYAWLPQVLVLFTLIGAAGPKFNTTTSSVGVSANVAANRLSYLSLCMSLPIAWCASAADYFVDYRATMPKRRIGLVGYISNTVTYTFGFLLGIGLASGVSSNSSWSTAYSSSPGSLTLAGFSPLGAFGKLCGVILALGIISVHVALTYSAGIVLQILLLDSRVAKTPRWLLTLIAVCVYTAFALGGRNHLFSILRNFLALMGYWNATFLCIVLEEHLLFSWRHSRYASRTNRQNKKRDEEHGEEHNEEHDGAFDWGNWEDRKTVPHGAAALAAFLFGWVGAVVDMKQAWFTGPIAKLFGKEGCDLGLWAGCLVTSVTYPIMREVELRIWKR